MLNLTLTQGEKSETIGTTPEHPFYVVGRGFVSAGDLVLGMVIRQVSSDVKSQLLSEVSMNAPLIVQKLVYDHTPTKVYNFTVADSHTYVVGSSKALVHNTYIFPGRIHQKLVQSMSNRYRGEATKIWQKINGYRAYSKNLSIHHRIPLEWSHLFPRANPNRYANLIALNSKTHKMIHNDYLRSWDVFRAHYKALGREPTASEVMKKVLRLDRQYGNWYNRITKTN